MISGPEGLYERTLGSRIIHPHFQKSILEENKGIPESRSKQAGKQFPGPEDSWIRWELVSSD